MTDSETGEPQLPPPTVSGAPQEVAPGVYVVPDARVPLVPNIGIVLGEQKALVVDTGMGPANGERVLAAARALAGDRQIVLTVTHFHPEHGYGAQAFRDTAIVYNRAQLEELRAKGDAYLAMFRTFGDGVARFAARRGGGCPGLKAGRTSLGFAATGSCGTGITVRLGCVVVVVGADAVAAAAASNSGTETGVTGVFARIADFATAICFAARGACRCGSTSTLVTKSMCVVIAARWLNNTMISWNVCSDV